MTVALLLSAIGLAACADQVVRSGGGSPEVVIQGNPGNLNMWTTSSPANLEVFGLRNRGLRAARIVTVTFTTKGPVRASDSIVRPSAGNHWLGFYCCGYGSDRNISHWYRPQMPAVGAVLLPRKTYGFVVRLTLPGAGRAAGLVNSANVRYMVGSVTYRLKVPLRLEVCRGVPLNSCRNGLILGA